MQASFPPLSLYLHLPWCVRKCPYCDFNSHRAGNVAEFDRYADALIADIQQEAGRADGRVVESIFIGGGTPSLFSADAIGRILAHCQDVLSLDTDCEITMEANPGTVEHGKLAGYRHAGVNRLSLGAQSFDSGMLRVLGRIHGPEDIRRAFDEADAAGFGSINLDVMFALPGQDVELALADLEEAISLGPSHLSWYQLTLEPNTVFHQAPPSGIPDDGLAWEIQEAGQALLAGAGFDQYEVSAYARQGHRCRHNLNYWTFGDYLAAGAGAHGKLTVGSKDRYRYSKPAHPRAYMESIERGDEAQRISIPDTDIEFEFMLNALRLTEGFSSSLYESRTGRSVGGANDKLGVAAADGLMQLSGDEQWRPTPRGFQFLNDLQARFLPG